MKKKKFIPQPGRQQRVRMFGDTPEAMEQQETRAKSEGLSWCAWVRRVLREELKKP